MNERTYRGSREMKEGALGRIPWPLQPCSSLPSPMPQGRVPAQSPYQLAERLTPHWARKEVPLLVL